jgi:hypothetical protein
LNRILVLLKQIRRLAKQRKPHRQSNAFLQFVANSLFAKMLSKR